MNQNKQQGGRERETIKTLFAMNYEGIIMRSYNLREIKYISR